MLATTSGKVYLVGAGPGHPDLLTVRAVRLIQAADVIVYDRLIQQEVLALAKPTAQKIFMGKALGKHASRQSKIHELLVQQAKLGKVVIRLKGGDPFLFGRGGEEAEYLVEHGVAFEVVPGVSSCLSAPLSAGIPVTHRDVASSVVIVTGHNSCGHDDRTDWQALSKVDTLVVLMSVHNVGRITQALIDAGRSCDTPAAMVQMAFWPGQQVVVGTLETIAEEVRRARVEAPATLVIGEVVRLHEKLKQDSAGAAYDWQRSILDMLVPVGGQPEDHSWNLSEQDDDDSPRAAAFEEEVL
ncbi:uroporphyrinogen-III C-methyltransferase-like protein DsrWa [Candidatus Sulfotelmatobacter kueseliae]|uniref:uroporphyrinogen-III C-methyltransferase n=1 Tax=Candidatus Sulfotelmatobacter kueseliae TaxID=2042962 RepID=A0A2U3JY77_9BACT|nr:uroporphyrinogen-III C-methyltransferase-like protein DsrWa [Candidatus Sulfotelmatobacter kueseliae]